MDDRPSVPDVIPTCGEHHSILGDPIYPTKQLARCEFAFFVQKATVCDIDSIFPLIASAPLNDVDMRWFMIV